MTLISLSLHVRFCIVLPTVHCNVFSVSIFQAKTLFSDFRFILSRVAIVLTFGE
jgi:hypothetical protein